MHKCVYVYMWKHVDVRWALIAVINEPAVCVATPVLEA